MDFLCTNCGYINEKNDALTCEKCQTQFDEESYEKLRDYVKRAIQYGYEYRVEYENQVEKQGEVNTKYFLLDPTTYTEWVAVAVLSGVAGNLVYDIVKYVAQQINAKLTNKDKLDHQNQKTLELISDNKKLNKFITYIQAYYNGNSKLDKKVEAAVLEEEMAHAITDDMDDELKEIMQKLDPKASNSTDVFRELILKAARTAEMKRWEKPTTRELQEILKGLKKEVKNLKKENNKRRRKK